ncbi:transposase [Clostridium botulinum]|uniref:transposase n=1 Tax=Clostridium botulinum TaxID=1491 RepID=UPI001788D1CB|nr:transposase [Clostridium botulinum]MBE1304080.1 transposase [Clostridium botulinum]
MAKAPKQRYVLNLKLKTQPFQENILDKRFEIGRKVYNAVLGQALKRYREMIKTKRWRENQNNISNIYKVEKDDKKRNKLCKLYFNIKNNMLKEFRLNEYSLHADVKQIQRHFKKNIDSFTAQKIATRVYKAIDDSLFGKGEEIHFKGVNKPLNSLEGKSNGTGIRYNIETNMFSWNGLEIPVKLDINNKYETDALRDKICFCRIKRKFVRGKYKYILQLILEGIPPIKINKQGEVKNDIGSGVCGIDIGTQTVAYISDYDCKLLELAPRVQNIEDEKRKILRYMDRSKRTINPNNFNEDGTIKRGIKLEWNYSNKYIKAKNKLKDLYRKQADIREQDHNIMINKILKNCDTVYVEDMNYKALQKRSKSTEKNDKGKFKRKKRFGKSLANKAPSMFLAILQNKLKAKGGLYYKINTREVKASQYNHLNKEYNKKKLSQRWNYFNYAGKKIKVQRDLYSSYLIKNVNDDLKSINNELCIKDFNKFLKMHNKEILRLQGLKSNLSSMGI